MANRDVTSDAANSDKATPTIADKAMIIDVSTNPDSLKETTLDNLYKVINGLTEDTAPDETADFIPTYDASASAGKKASIVNMLKRINNLTADSAPDITADYVVTYDASASTVKKVLLQKMGTGFVLQAQQGSFSPADSTTHYFGIPGRALAETTAARRKIYIPVACTLTRADIQVFNAGGTAGTTETSTLSFRYNDTTDTSLTTGLQNNQAAETSTYYNITGLSVACSAGSFFELKWATPAWVTNPTGVIITVNLYFAG